MAKLSKQKLVGMAETIDHFVTLDLTGLGYIGPLYRALQERQPGFMCLGAAQLAKKHLKPGGGPALITTGFPMGGGLAETDGPVGAAMLARAFWYALGAYSILVIDEDWVPVLRGACIGAGLMPVELPKDGHVGEMPYLRQVYIHPLPKGGKASRRAGERLLDLVKPALLASVERPGCNSKGCWHGLNGRPLIDCVADVDHTFKLGMQRGIPFLAVGDGGNELGMGLIKSSLPAFMPQAADCGCPCGGGTAVELGCDHLVTACVSNWGVTGIIAALALEQGRLDILHDPHLEVRSIEHCASAGGLDGGSTAPEPAVDGITASDWGGLLSALKSTLARGMGIMADWRHG